MQSNQYYPVIIQIGARSVSAGFAGDAVPTIRTTTNAYDLRDAQLDQSGLNHAVDVHAESGDNHHQGNALWTYDLVGCDFAQLEGMLERITYDLYLRNLLVDAKKCKVLIAEPVFFPMPLKKTLTKVLLFHIHAQSVSFYPEPILSCISSGSNNALVVDLGWNQTTITPVYDLRIIYRDIRTTNRAGKALHDTVRRALQELGTIKEEDLDFEFIEALICDTFYCTTKDFKERSDGDFQFNSINIPNSIRNTLLESFLFQEDLESLDDEGQLIIPIMKRVLEGLPIDLRSGLSTNIIFTGGLSNIPGLKTRILEELETQVTLPVDALDAAGAWQGASLYCSTSSMSQYATSASKKNNELHRDRYLNGESALTDWTDQIYYVPDKS